MTTFAKQKSSQYGLPQFWAGAADHPSEFSKLIASHWPDLDNEALDRIGQSREILMTELVNAIALSENDAEKQIIAWERLNTGG